MNKYILISTLASAAALFGCSTEPSQTTPPEPPREKPVVTPVEQGEMPTDHVDIGTFNVLSKGPRRMSVDQFERSIEKIGQLPAGTVDLGPSLSVALGEPDYLRVTEESLEPSPLFMKVMMDLAAYVCNALSDYDAQRPVEDRVLTRYEDEEQNIRYMLLRFTAIEGASADEYVTRLKETRAAGATGARGPRGGWEAVCISLVTSPEFLTY